MSYRKILLAFCIGLLAYAGYAMFGEGIAGVGSGVKPSTEIVLKDGDTYDMTASYVVQTIAGKSQKMLAYNGMIPGPTIRVGQGARVTINFKNDTDMPALLHSHGVRMDQPYDGAQTSQSEIAPGASFTYKLVFPDAGVFWYHPHVSEVYQQARGLYGAFVVTPKDVSYFPPVNRELPVFVSDLPVSSDGTVTITKETNDHALMGHFGNVMLINGRETFALSATQGEVVRLYLINAANTRPFKIAIPGVKIKVVGSDNGAYEKAFYADSVILGPSERAIVDVMFYSPGEFTIKNATPESSYTLGTITVAEGSPATSYKTQFETLQKNNVVSKSIDPLRNHFAGTPDKSLVLGLSMGAGAMQGVRGHTMPDGSMMHGMSHASSDGIEWEDAMPMMGSATTDVVKWTITDKATGKSNMDIDWTLVKDAPLKIHIFNDPNSMHPMQHPIHFHGQRFVVVSRNGVPETNLVWKDTTLVRAGETVDIVLEPSNPGLWMAHCHISEHLQSGMMFHFIVK